MLMLLLKMVQKLVQALNSEGTPFQVAAGVAMGAALGLTPLVNVHNAVIALVALMLNISLAGFFLGWTLLLPFGFVLDPLFDRIGSALLAAPSLQGLWTDLYNMPIVPYTNFNNSIVLGSVVFWLVMFVPILLAAKYGVTRYRERVYARLVKTRFFSAVKASKVYQTYRLFRPD